MENFTNILKQFTVKQRIIVLVLLLVFTSGTSVITTYLTSDYNSCRDIIKENRELLNDYIVISQLIRSQEQPQVESMVTRSPSSVMVVESINDHMIDSILTISEKHIK